MSASTESQPVSSVRWVDADELRANYWNPNRQAKPERDLLVTSMLENGWTQPIVVRRDQDAGTYEIVDGFHRWGTVRDVTEVWDMTGGMVPIVELDSCSEEQAKASTVRHNRARGAHYVRDVSQIVHDLVDSGMTLKQVGHELGMDSEEVERMALLGRMSDEASRDEFGQSWRPVRG